MPDEDATKTHLKSSLSQLKIRAGRAIAEIA
jgi:hypothetical protein